MRSAGFKSSNGPSAAVILSIAAAIPPLLLVAGVVLLAIRPASRDLFWPPAASTLPEAAALRDAARVRFLVRKGGDMRARGIVRRDILRGDAVELTPLEAAAAEGHVEILRVLYELGVAPSADELTSASCIAVRRRRSEFIAELRERTGRTPPSDCHTVPDPLAQ